MIICELLGVDVIVLETWARDPNTHAARVWCIVSPTCSFALKQMLVKFQH